MRLRFWLLLSLTLWAIQAVALCALGLLALTLPQITEELLTGRWDVIQGLFQAWSTNELGEFLRVIDSDQGATVIPLAGSLLLGAGVVVLWNLQPDARWLYRGISKTLAIPLVTMTIFFWLGKPATSLGNLLIGAIVPLVMLVIYQLGGRARTIAERSSGAMPNANYTALPAASFWRVQALWWLLIGLALIVLPDKCLEQYFQNSSYPSSSQRQVAEMIMRGAGVGALMLGSVSLLAAGPQRGRSFLRFCWLFVLTHALFLATLLVSYGSVHRSATVTLVACPTAALLLMNLAFGMNPKWVYTTIEWLRERIRWAWFMQLVLFASSGLLWLFGTKDHLDSLAGAGQEGGVSEEACTRLVGYVAQGDSLARLLYSDCEHVVGVFALRAIGPLALTMAAFALMGLLLDDRRLNWRLSKVMLVFFSGWSGVFLYNITNNPGQGDESLIKLLMGSAFGAALAVPSLIFLAYNALVSLSPDPQPELDQYQGVADTKPRYLFVSWKAQAVLFLALGVIQMVFPSEFANYLILEPKSSYNLNAVEMDLIRMTAPYWLALGATSVIAAWTSQQWVWRHFARLFTVGLALWIFTFVQGFNPEKFRNTVTSVVVLMGMFMLMNLLAMRTPKSLRNIGKEEAPSGLLVDDYLTAALMFLQTLFNRRRASHLVGVGAHGSMRVSVPPLDDKSGFPHNDFFHSYRNKSLTVQARFSNLTSEDDAALDVRGAAIRLCHEEEPLLDMVMNTGSFSAARNMHEFASFVVSKWVPRRWIRRALDGGNTVAREGAVAGLRRAPSSYGTLFYYSQLARLWFGVEQPGEDPLLVEANEAGAEAFPGAMPALVTRAAKEARKERVFGRRKVFLVRYRLAPDDLNEEDESGLPDESDAAHLWKRERRPDAGVSKNYLRVELVERLQREQPLRFRLQAQFKEVDEPGLSRGEQLAWYNAGVDWPQGCQWWDLGTIELKKIMSEREAEELRFNPNLHPSSMGIPESPNMRDYRSLAYSEARVMHVLSHVRHALSKLFGAPRAQVFTKRSQLDASLAVREPKLMTSAPEAVVEPRPHAHETSTTNSEQTEEAA